ncbi:MAG: ABC transporter ATP-binding protein [Carbonactinosporaceae bacterium]
MECLDSALVWTRGLEKSYGPTAALHGVTVGVGEREILAVTGPYGSGKSTLLHCLAAILAPDAGEVWYGGTPVHTLTERARSKLRREHFGLISQGAHLVPELSAEENVALPLLLSGARRSGALGAAREWLERLEATHCSRLRPGSLSAVETRCVAAARALVGRPEVLFADEPTATLDTAQAEHHMRMLTSVVRSQSIALVVVTKDARLGSHADRVLGARDGGLEPVEVPA